MDNKNSLAVFLLLVLLSACGDGDVSELTVSEDYVVPLNCTIPGKLELGSDTENHLKKYLQADDSASGITSPVAR